MKLKIVTAIADPDKEKYITSLLFSQGCNIVFRALSVTNLKNFISNQTEPLIILYTKRFLTNLELQEFLKLNVKHRYVEVNLQNFSASKLLSEISTLEQSQKSYDIERISRVAAVLGTPGSPGVSTVANFLALYVSGEVIAASHHNLRPKSNTKVLNSSPDTLTEDIKSSQAVKIIVDAGSTLNLTSAFSDRRLNSKWLRYVVGSCSTLFYVVKSDDFGIEYLTTFLTDFDNLINPPKIVFILNQQKFDRPSQEIQSKFRSLLNEPRKFFLPYTNCLSQDFSLKSSIISPWRANSYRKQIAKIGSQVL